MASGGSSSGEVGFVGIGNMGSLMAKHLINKGHKVTVFDLNKSAVNELVKQGAKAATSVAQLGETCQRVFTMLPTPDIIIDTYTGQDGLLSCASSSTVLVDSSTIDPGTAQLVHKAASAKNVKFFDAPVAGAVPAARAGTLVFMVGGDEKDIKELLEPYLLCMGTSVYPCGPIGSGCVAKICNNMMLAISMLGLSEALHLGKNFGLDPKMVSEIINKGSGRCWSSEIYNPHPGIVPTAPSTNDYNGGFRASLLYKDLGLASKVAREVCSPTPLGSLTHEIYRLLVNDGQLSDKDFSVVYKYLSKKN
jgi:3-hydroxyisobutyrate dehydrogenase